MQFKNERIFFEYIREKGGTAYLVGGAVRDEMMGKAPADRDYVVTGLRADDLPDFEKIAGQSFPVFYVTIGDICEVALARSEKKNGYGYHGFEFQSGPEITIEQDLSRRDLTINAMAKDVLTGEIVDPYGGADDLKNKLLRHVSHAFADDPLRVYRVARFAAQLNFSIDLQTKLLMMSMKYALHYLAAERVWIELKKVLNSKAPARFFTELKYLNLLDVHFPEVEALDVPDKHDGTAFNHTMNLLHLVEEPVRVFALLCHDFGKGLTPKEDRPAHIGHDKLGVAAIATFCDRLKVPNEYRNFAINFSANHMRLKTFAQWRPSKIIRFVQKYPAENFLYLSHVDSAFHNGDYDRKSQADYYLHSALARIAWESIANVTGEQLINEGYPPGKKLGEMLLERRVGYFKKIVNELNKSE